MWMKILLSYCFYIAQDQVFLCSITIGNGNCRYGLDFETRMQIGALVLHKVLAALCT
ncbi:hypothetical protein CDL12_14658 [Handroanthus impetiginosus]|uniref:Uncharacterized protein n=1 Tax=Handroanthus impetiginosus TaxID=429701 RepID=A0A2G9H5E5_9LAMI|nr:hypothetical protein CDL12_14658 [Handroanthus impetiginosus]